MSETLEGGCYCGAVRYRLTLPVIFVNACHCRDCQKLSGAAFALNAMVERHRIAIVAGTPLRREDKDGHSILCGGCGGGLWATTGYFGEQLLFLRAGTLDRAEALPPDAHFFVSRKHPWIVLPDFVPAYAELPGPDDPPAWSDAVRQRVAAARAA